jgi:S-adenosylmethionine:tRNA ribosyltransferase-isomerase
MVSQAGRHRHARFDDLPFYLHPGDLLVINQSATLPASLPAQIPGTRFILNLSTNYGGGLWLAEPRHSPTEPGPLPDLSAGDIIDVAGVKARLTAQFPGLPRLWFVRFKGDIRQLLYQTGKPIRYGYLQGEYDLDHYQTLFARIPGSAEMPSAAYPFTRRVVKRLEERGIDIAPITLHTGVSSLEVEVEDIQQHTLYPEPYHVPCLTAEAINNARAKHRRVIAVGTTVVRALASACDGWQVHPSSGFTKVYIRPGRSPGPINGLLTGFHDPATSHLAMLYAISSKELIQDAYNEAVRVGYRWHEFGDSHLILTDPVK